MTFVKIFLNSFNFLESFWMLLFILFFLSLICFSLLELCHTFYCLFFFLEFSIPKPSIWVGASPALQNAMETSFSRVFWSLCHLRSWFAGLYPLKVKIRKDMRTSKVCFPIHSFKRRNRAPICWLSPNNGWGQGWPESKGGELILGFLHEWQEPQSPVPPPQLPVVRVSRKLKLGEEGKTRPQNSSLGHRCPNHWAKLSPPHIDLKFLHMWEMSIRCPQAW